MEKLTIKQRKEKIAHAMEKWTHLDEHGSVYLSITEYHSLRKELEEIINANIEEEQEEINISP